MRSQKMDHVIRSQGWAAGCADKPPGYGGRMSSRQISDIHESETRARPNVTSLYLANIGGGEVMSQR